MTPNDRKYTRDHEWVLTDGNNAKIGITDHAQDSLGDIVFVELPEIDTEFKCGDSFAVVESVKAASEIYTPVCGKVIAVNQDLDCTPELINSDPYGAFIAEIEITGATDGLMTAEEYDAFVAAEA